jgi:hypothetical protein
MNPTGDDMAGMARIALADPAAIRADLERRWRAVDDEIRHYPTPIARCDVQLTALIEARDELRAMRSIDDDARLLDAYARAFERWGCRSVILSRRRSSPPP